jgi:UDP-N-acetylglucosamine 2-epimerase (non-hydrolysing)
VKILSVVGTRPNFMKMAPIIAALRERAPQVRHVLVHTGQHYDARMSGSFFQDLQMPAPDHNLAVGSGSHAQMTAAVMTLLEPVLEAEKPDLVLVVGDVNSTLAAAITAKKLNMTVGHVEAGLRSGDMTMPEEINRLCVDAIADHLFTTDRLADENLLREGVAADRIHFVGNVMIDSLMAHLKVAEKLAYHTTLGLEAGTYGTLTLHRPANVEEPEKLDEILSAIATAVPDLPVVFPIHPRTRSRIEKFGFADRFVAEPGLPGIYLTDPLGYVEFLSLNRHARLVMTDSGGLQEETTILGVPCVTLRDNTERPITITQGTNRLGGTSRDGIIKAIGEAMALGLAHGKRPEKWDGHAAERIVDLVVSGLRKP